ncbi:MULTISPECIES: helix-turn-helix domain-containing protein [Vagococcus]|uniref:HTH cro/C1-type domain-containing protein n=1 Tax=Vagococcus luciliae TaxID=2920380 RepID=A0ABY5P192_9ENTE|nr:MULTISPECIES: helix-turn-helix transcriptional regulator [Vagococcus]UUV99588.1 hypothetical protein G314FT_17490 [Vagococcus luciliae]
MENNFSKILGERLLKISDVHKGTGISKTTLANIYFKRSKDMKVSTLLMICNFLDVSILDFLGGE